MRLHLTFSLTLLLLFTIAGTRVFSQVNSRAVVNPNKPEHRSSTETVPYDSRVYNECTSEWVHLTGLVTYRVKEMLSDNKYFILYQINLKQVRGVGETSGALYKGGGIIKDRVNAVNENGHVVGNSLYKVRYKAPNTTLTFNQKAHYVFSNNEVKVEFNDTADSCE